MDQTMEVIGLLLIFAVRLGIPILLTILLAWGLKRLDAHWQAEAEEKAASPQMKRLSTARLNCWELQNCDKQRRSNCAAFRQSETPCWEVYRTDGNLRETCRNCKVFGRALALTGL